MLRYNISEFAVCQPNRGLRRVFRRCALKCPSLFGVDIFLTLLWMRNSGYFKICLPISMQCAIIIPEPFICIQETL